MSDSRARSRANSNISNRNGVTRHIKAMRVVHSFSILLSHSALSEMVYGWLGQRIYWRLFRAQDGDNQMDNFHLISVTELLNSLLLRDMLRATSWESGGNSFPLIGIPICFQIIHLSHDISGDIQDPEVSHFRLPPLKDVEITRSKNVVSDCKKKLVKIL